MSKPLFKTTKPAWIMLTVVSGVLLSLLALELAFPAGKQASKPVVTGPPIVTVKIPFTNRVATQALANDLNTKLLKFNGAYKIMGAACVRTGGSNFKCLAIVQTVATRQDACISANYTVSSTGKLENLKYVTVSNASCGLK